MQVQLNLYLYSLHILYFLLWKQILIILHSPSPFCKGNLESLSANKFLQFHILTITRRVTHDIIEKVTLSAIPKTGGCSVKGPKIPRFFNNLFFKRYQWKLFETITWRNTAVNNASECIGKLLKKLGNAVLNFWYPTNMVNVKPILSILFIKIQL